MRPLAFFAALALAVPLAVPIAGCATVTQTTLDEKAAIGVETAYTAAARAAKLAITSGAVTDPAKIRQIGDADNRAFAAVQAVRAAYAAGNANSYAAAFVEADAAVKALLASF